MYEVLLFIFLILHKGDKRRPQQSNGSGNKPRQSPKSEAKPLLDHKPTKGIGSSSGVIFISF